MSETSPRSQGFFHELRRRRVFTTAGLYVVGAWLVMQAADVFFPGWGVPDTGINVLLAAAVIGFPLALVFGWFFNITAQGIRRTMPAGPEGAAEPRSLQGRDYLVLGSLVLVAAGIVFDATHRILDLPRTVGDSYETRMGPAPDERPANSVAVLPFVNVSDDPGNEYFCDGVSNEILNKLAAHVELHVTGRTSSFVFKGSDYGIPRISALLGVRYLLQGSVQKVGDKLRISAQLVDDSGAQRWSNSFDRTLTDIFAIQTEIADLVATTVVPQIVPEPSVSYEPSVDAYGHFLAGREWNYRRDPRARNELRKAIELDPGYAEPYPELAIAALIGNPDETDFAEAREAIETALTLHPRMPRALAAKGLYFEQQPQPDNEAAEAVLRQALEQDPNSLDAMNWLAGALQSQGKTSEANALYHRAYGLDPLHPSIGTNLATNYLYKGDLVRAEQILLRLVQVPDPAHHPFLYLAWINGLLAMWDRAEYFAQRALYDWPDDPINPWYATVVKTMKGNYQGALEEFNRYIVSNELELTDSRWNRTLYGPVLAMAGDYKAAIEVLQSDYEGTQVMLQDDFELDARQSLAWALMETGGQERAIALLDAIERAAASRGNISPQSSQTTFYLARNAALLGEKELGLERLKLAIDTGWRGYYTDSHDPRLSSIADDPRFKTMMAEVKADVDRQRAEVEASHPSLGLPALSD